MPFCENCGVEADSKFCPSCGKPINVTKTVLQRIFKFGAIGLGVLLVIFILLVIIGSPEDGGSESTQNPTSLHDTQNTQKAAEIVDLFSGINNDLNSGNLEGAELKVNDVKNKIYDLQQVACVNPSDDCKSLVCLAGYSDVYQQYIRFVRTINEFSNNAVDINKNVELFTQNLVTGKISYPEYQKALFGQFDDFCDNKDGYISEIQMSINNLAASGACDSTELLGMSANLNEITGQLSSTCVEISVAKDQIQTALCEKIDCTTTGQQQLFFSSNICPKIQPNEPLIRNKAVKIAKEFSGTWNVGQLFSLYDWMQNSIDGTKYVSDPSGSEYFATAIETLSDGAGDCEDQAILLNSMVQSIGGTAKIIAIPECSHAFAAVYLGPTKTYFDDTANTIRSLYLDKKGRIVGDITGYSDEQGYWLIMDPTGGTFLGDVFPNCRDKKFQPIC